MQWAKHKQSGFTIVELLIVVVVIAILAAITIVAYNGIQSRAKASAVQSGLSQASRKLLSYAALNADQLPRSLAEAGIVGDSVTYQYSVDTTARMYCITATTQSISYYLASGSSVTSGACPGHSTNGQITNRATNASFEGGTIGWMTSSSTIASSTEWSDNGSRSIVVGNTSSTSGLGDARITGGSVNYMPFGMEAGKTYTISAKVRYTAAPTGDNARGPGILTWYSPNGGSWIESFGPKPPATPGVYTVYNTVSLPANTTGVLIALGAASNTPNQQFFYDSLMITEGTGGYTFADGTTSGWSWSGNANTSSSFGLPL